MARAFEIEEDEISDDEVEVPFGGTAIAVPYTPTGEIIPDFYSFVGSRGRPVEAKEIGELISRLTMKSRLGSVSRSVATGDPYTDLKIILFNVGSGMVSAGIIRYFRELISLITQEETNKLFRLSLQNLNRLIFFINNVNLTQYMKNTAVYYAAKHVHFELVKYLIELGADVHEGDDYIFRKAVANGNLELVKYLVELGADVHVLNDYALREAALNGHLEIVRYLVEHGANPHVLNDVAIRWAEEAGHHEVAEYLRNLP